MVTRSSTLAWEIPWTEEPDRLPSMGSQRSQTGLSDQTIATMTGDVRNLFLCLFAIHVSSLVKYLLKSSAYFLKMDKLLGSICIHVYMMMMMMMMI